MLADHVRTSTYQRAFMENARDFQDAIVLDVGTGTGILAFFAVQAGARKVYAVEASDSAEIAKKLEEITLPEKVDIIISEPIGFLLPGGIMLPSTGSIVLAPITDQALHDEQKAKIDEAVPIAEEEYFTQAIVGFFPVSSIISPNRTVHTIDFATVLPEEFHEFKIEYVFRIETTALMHGFGGWFDIDFIGTQKTIILSTAPDQPGTHWYQCRLLFHQPLAVNKGQYVSGELHFRVNDKHSYNIEMSARIDGTPIETFSKVNLHDQQYNYLYTDNTGATQ
eukprot:GSChrysophyteH1.ASY1.ANO1.1799.1 assembled CDS